MLKNTYKSYPNEKGYFGQFGGRYVSETLMPLILEVEKEYEKIKNDKNFIIVTPGIRIISKLKSDDQKRVETPKKAIKLGANYLVIGRPITKSRDPLKTLKEINKSLI